MTQPRLAVLLLLATLLTGCGQATTPEACEKELLSLWSEGLATGEDVGLPSEGERTPACEGLSEEEYDEVLRTVTPQMMGELFEGL